MLIKFSDKNLKAKNGKTITTADLGSEYGFKDADGKQYIIKIEMYHAYNNYTH